MSVVYGLSQTSLVAVSKELAVLENGRRRTRMKSAIEVEYVANLALLFLVNTDAIATSIGARER